MHISLRQKSTHHHLFLPQLKAWAAVNVSIQMQPASNLNAQSDQALKILFDIKEPNAKSAKIYLCLYAFTAPLPILHLASSAGECKLEMQNVYAVHLFLHPQDLVQDLAALQVRTSIDTNLTVALQSCFHSEVLAAGIGGMSLKYLIQSHKVGSVVCIFCLTTFVVDPYTSSNAFPGFPPIFPGVSSSSSYSNHFSQDSFALPCKKYDETLSESHSLTKVFNAILDL